MSWFRKRPPRSGEGTAAREAAERALAETKSRRHEVTRVAVALRTMRERNHFAETIAELYAGGNGA